MFENEKLDREKCMCKLKIEYKKIYSTEIGLYAYNLNVYNQIIRV